MATDKTKTADKNNPDSKVPDKKIIEKRILAFVERCENPAELESLIKNATRLGNTTVAEAAFRKRIALVPAERPGSVEHDFWQMVQAFEYTLSEERGKNKRLSRTRQKVAKDGVVQTLRYWAVGSQETAGFRMLLERGMQEFTGEAITLRHPEHFALPVLEAAQQRQAQQVASQFTEVKEANSSANAKIENLKNLSDAHNHSFGEHYGVLITDLPVPLLARSVFVVDASNTIKYVEIIPEIAQEPNYEPALKALKEAAG